MNDELEDDFPMIVLLLDRVRRVSVDEARRVVRAELGDDAAASVNKPIEDPDGMEYIQWRHLATAGMLGTSCQRYVRFSSEEIVDGEGNVVGTMKVTMHDEVPPEEEAARAAWMRHAAWMYVDSFNLDSQHKDHQTLIRNVFKIASHFVDERCVLLWHWGEGPKRVAMPTPEAVASLRAGEWPA